MTRRLHDERGFTLTELMIAITIGMVVILASLNVLDGASRHNDDIQRRAAGLQHGRAAMDEVVRTLRSQVCVKPNDTTILPPFEAASGSSATVHADFSDGTGLPEKHTITLGSTGSLTDTKVTGSGTPEATTFTATPTTRVIGERLSASGTTPVFQYFAFNTASPPTPDLALNSASSPTVAAADLPRIARILITMQANPEGIPNPKLTTTVEDQVFVRLADPDDAAPLPKCS